VALVNSVRLVGHEEPVFLVDARLTPHQRELLALHVRIVAAPNGVPAVLLKLVGPLEHPARVAILIDTDVIVVRALTELVEAADGGRLVAFVNNPPNDERFFAQWSAVLGLVPLRRQPYPAAGQLLMPHALTQWVLVQWAESQSKIALRRTWMGRGTLADPFYFADMDVFGRDGGKLRAPRRGQQDRQTLGAPTEQQGRHARDRGAQPAAPRAWPVHRLVSTARRAARRSRSPANRRYPAATSARSEALRRRAASATRATSSTVSVSATRARAAGRGQCLPA
jgi:hypothetical protein